MTVPGHIPLCQSLPSLYHYTCFLFYIKGAATERKFYTSMLHAIWNRNEEQNSWEWCWMFCACFPYWISFILFNAECFVLSLSILAMRAVHFWKNSPNITAWIRSHWKLTIKNYEKSFFLLHFPIFISSFFSIMMIVTLTTKNRNV